MLGSVPGGLILVANHPSMLDALILFARLPSGVCIMKADLMRNPFLGTGAQLARYIRNDSTRGMIRCAAACLRPVRSRSRPRGAPEPTNTAS